MDELDLLKKKKDELDRAYYVEHTSLISDQEYDELVKQIESLQGQAQTDTESVGSDLSGDFPTHTHSSPMLSIDNTYDFIGVKKFIESTLKKAETTSANFTMEPKIDGLSLSLHYEDHKLTLAVTRGNGIQGDVVTENAKHIKDIPNKIDKSAPSHCEIRGEVYMRKTTFDSLNKSRKEANEPLLANPRNAASGALKMKDPLQSAERKLSFFAFQLFDRNPQTSLKSQNEIIKLLRKINFPVADSIHLHNNVDDILKEINKFEKARSNLDYETDGLVIKLDDIDLQSKCGSTSKSPRWCIAYKFPAEKATSTILDVTYQVGRTGVVTPVAELTPTELSGTTVKRATLHNFELIEEKGLKIGSQVEIQKAGEIIPQVLKLSSEQSGNKLSYITPPTDCPSCGRELSHIKAPSPTIICQHIDCPDRVKNSIMYFSSRDNMNIEGLGQKIIDTLVDNEAVSKLSDLYRLTTQDLLKLEGFAEKSAEQLINNIAESKSRKFETILTSLGIPGLGKQGVRNICHAYISMRELQEASSESLCEIEGIGPILAQNITEWFANPSLTQDWIELEQLGLNFKNEEIADIDTPLPLKGLSFVITGTLSKPRSDFEKTIESNGGIVKSSISKKTDYLLFGENAGSKLSKAQKLDVKTINESEFDNLI